MQPQIQNTEFGFITVDGEEIDHDILIRLSGKVKKRKKKLSKEKLVTRTPFPWPKANTSSMRVPGG